MRICVIMSTEKRLRRGYEMSAAGSAGPLEVEMLLLQREKGRRAIRRAAREMIKRGITSVAAEDGFPYHKELNSEGVGAVSLRRLEGIKLAQMAMQFSERLGYPPENTGFIFRTGGFSTVYEAAAALVQKTRNIAIDCNSRIPISEQIFNETGAVMRRVSDITSRFGHVIELFFSEETGAILRSGEDSVELSDFEIILPEKYRDIIPAACAAQTAAALLSYGFIRPNQIEIILKN